MLSCILKRQLGYHETEKYFVLYIYIYRGWERLTPLYLFSGLDDADSQSKFEIFNFLSNSNMLLLHSRRE